MRTAIDAGTAIVAFGRLLGGHVYDLSKRLTDEDF
jgi:hypothetical protein